MNANNYGSLEACKRLVDAGIVLRTEGRWRTPSWSENKEEWVLDYQDVVSPKFSIPAPSMAEVWRELPEGKVWLHKCFTGEHEAAFGVNEASYRNTNPTGALIDLLIWVKKEKKDE